MTPDTLAAVAQTDGFDQAVVGFDDGIDEDEAARRVQDRLPEAISVYSFSSPPPDVANLLGVQFLPRVLGLFLGLLAVAAVGHALATSVRRRRHDLGVVRAVGFVARDVLRAAHDAVVDARRHRPGLRHPARHRAGTGGLAGGRRPDRGAAIRAHLAARAAGGRAARVPRGRGPVGAARRGGGPPALGRRPARRVAEATTGAYPPRMVKFRNRGGGLSVEPRGPPGDGRPRHRGGWRHGRRHRRRAAPAARGGGRRRRPASTSTTSSARSTRAGRAAPSTRPTSRSCRRCPTPSTTSRGSGRRATGSAATTRTPRSCCSPAG